MRCRQVWAGCAGVALVLATGVPAAAMRIEGTDGDDVLIGTQDSDVVVAGAGNDVVDAGAGDDTVRGGPGDDVLHGRDGVDYLVGGGGADVLRGGPGSDGTSPSSEAAGFMSGGLDGGPGDDLLYGGAGSDFLAGRDGADVLRGGPGHDVFSVLSDGDVVFGGEGRDIADFLGGSGSATVSLGPGADAAYVYSPKGIGVVVMTGKGPDDIDLLGGQIDVHAGPGADEVCRYNRGTGYKGAIRLGSSNDMLDAGRRCEVARNDGWNVVFGGPGDDLLYFAGLDPQSTSGPDSVFAGSGDDRIRIGNPNHDTVDCGPGHDVLTLVGGAEPDVIRGCEKVTRSSR